LRPSRTERLVIGLAEYVDIPEFRIAGLRAKIDTGARSSALHVEHLREIEHGWVSFDVRLHRSRSDRRVTVQAPIARWGTVRSSTGNTAPRIFVTVAVQIGPVQRVIDMGLVDRAQMIYRMLLGRTALGHDFLVDPSGRYLLTASRELVAERRVSNLPVRRGAK
jgi:hypothetical protein